MGEFDEFAKKLSGELSERTQRHNERLQREDEERTAGYRRDIAKLESEAWPVIEDARLACERQGVTFSAKKNWEREILMAPSIEIQASGEKVRPHNIGGSYPVEGDKAVVRVEDGRLRSDVRNGLSSRASDNFTSYEVDGLKLALRQVIQSVFDRLSPEASQ